jgi:hypothetical protein
LIDTRHNLQSIQPTFPDTGILFYSTLSVLPLLKLRVGYWYPTFSCPGFPEHAAPLELFQGSMTYLRG